MNLTIRQIMDYIFCPYYYKMKYEDNVLLKNTETLYDELIHKCYYIYLNHFKNTGETNLSLLMNSWGKFWIKENQTAKVMIKPSGNSKNRYDTLRKAGIRNLVSFDKMISGTKQYPIMVNKKFNIRINKHVNLTGDYEYIRETGACTDKHCFEILKLGHVKDAFMTEYQMMHSIELTAAMYAFKKTFNTDNVPIKGTWMNMSKNSVIESFKDENEYRLFEQTAIGTARCIASKIFPYSPDERCFICSYRNQCKIGGKK